MFSAVSVYDLKQLSFRMSFSKHINDTVKYIDPYELWPYYVISIPSLSKALFFSCSATDIKLIVLITIFELWFAMTRA